MDEVRLTAVAAVEYHLNRSRNLYCHHTTRTIITSSSYQRFDGHLALTTQASLQHYCRDRAAVSHT
jgi:hypothetical protein